MDCYICGAVGAIWPINSRPCDDGKPFFPFLEYHTPPENVKKVGINGEHHACNVCYSFLIQQWNSYEYNDTPLLKRLYWLKHPSFSQEQDEMEHFSLCDRENSLSESESSSNSYHPNSRSQTHSETSKIKRLTNADDSKNRWLSISEGSPHSKDYDQDGAYSNSETKSHMAQSNSERKICYVCRKSKPAYVLRTLHTKPQLKLETPFYPCLVTLYPDVNQMIDSQGRVSSCEECHQILFCQWQLFSKNGTPFSERKYDINAKINLNGESTFICFLCGLAEPVPAQLLCATHNSTNLPYFPFLKNLREPPGADTIDNGGNVKVCNNCSRLLYEQWNLFRKTSVPETDQVFSITNKKEHFSEPKLICRADVPSNVELLCFVCHKKDFRKNMKEIYSNPYANMDLSFLESIDKFPGTYFSRKHGQSLVCLPCYKSLTNQWKKFDEEDIQLNKREYKLKRYDYKEAQNMIKCEICLIDIPAKESESTYIMPRNDRSQPYFPFLARFIDYNQEGKISLNSCKFCHYNLVVQWEFYETLSHTDEERSQRHYKPHHFVCYICGDTTHRLDSKTVHWRSCELIISSNHVRPPCAFEIDGMVIICVRCKIMIDSCQKEKQCETKEMVVKKIKTEQIEDTTESNITEEHCDNQYIDSETDKTKVSPQTEENFECAGMKVTATVPPLASITKRNQDNTVMQNQGSTSRNDDEGSFAAALRKLAQQAIVPVSRKSSSRERQASPSASAFKAGSTASDNRKSPSSLAHSRPQSQSPFYMRSAGHRGNIPSSLAPVIPPPSIMEKEKAEMSAKANFGRSPSAEDSVSQRLSRGVIPGIFPRNIAPPESLNGCFRPNRDDPVRRHMDKPSLREQAEADPRVLGGSNLGNGPLNMHGIKDRGSNIGLVHPQPVRKLPDEDPSKSGMLSGARCNPLETSSSLFRPLSPTEGFSRYPMMPAVHQHNSQGPCPVHGHEAGHHHGSPGDHSSRGNRLPFDGLGVGSSEFRGMHPHHARLRDEFYNMNRLSIERREPVPNQIVEEDMRRRGYDWPWPMQHQVFENEHYRRHFMNGFRGHDHGYKELPHNQVYYSPHLFYGSEYPMHMDPYSHSSLQHHEAYPRRYPSNQLSPRLMDFYRRERNLSERPSDRSDSRRVGVINEKSEAEINERNREIERRNKIENIDDRRVEQHERKEEIANIFPLTRDRLKASSKPRDDKNNSFSIENISGRSHLDDESRKKMHIMDRLELITKSSKDSRSSIENIIIKEEATALEDNGSEFSNESDIKRKSIVQDENEASSKWPCSDESNLSPTDIAMENMEQKMNYMSSLGLITHGKRRALEEDYERKRWERKFRKMRGRPKKRRRREQTDDSEGRPCSELDFYNGPMTRHKQQLLQEQEMLLEQVQKNQGENNASKDTDENNDDNKFSDSFSSCATNQTLVSSPTHFTAQPHHPLSIETNHLDNRTASYAKSSHLLKLYDDSNQRKNFAHPDKNYSKFPESSSLKRRINESRELDCYVFGRRNIDESGSRFRWGGIEEVARSYITYKNEQEIQENRMKKMHDRLKNEDDILTKQRHQLQKDIMMLREKRNRLGENRQKLQNTAKNLHAALRSMANA